MSMVTRYFVCTEVNCIPWVILIGGDTLPTYHFLIFMVTEPISNTIQQSYYPERVLFVKKIVV